MNRNDCILAITAFAIVVVLTRCHSRVGDPVIPYSETPFKNGTVIMESGTGVSCDMMKWFTRSSITHVGVVCHDATGVPFLFHTSRPHSKLTRLDTWMRHRPTLNQVFVRHPHANISNRTMEATITPFIGVAYTYRVWKAVLRKWSCVQLPDSTDDGMFCSELVCRVFEGLGLMDFTGSSLSPSLALPGHFEGSDLPFVRGMSPVFRISLFQGHNEVPG